MTTKSTTERLVTMLRHRHKAGLKKYGVTVDRKDLKPDEWIQHAIEELLDGAAYLMRLRDEIAVSEVTKELFIIQGKVMKGQAKLIKSHMKRIHQLSNQNNRLKERLEKHRK